MMLENTNVSIVDDDDLARQSVKSLVESMGLRASCYSSGEEFWDAYDASQPGCLVTDVRLGGVSGIELMELLQHHNCALPVIVLTAFARTSLSVKAMQLGAVTVLDKPYEENELWEAVQKALAMDLRRREKLAERNAYRERWERLSDSERLVLKHVLAGKPNKSIATMLEVSTRTIENRRRAVYEKMGVETLAELVQAVVKAGVE